MLISIITIKTLNNKNPIIENKQTEHNWQKTEENLYCKHCNRNLKIGDWIAYKPDKIEKTVKISDEETGLKEYKENSSNEITQLEKENTNQEFYQEETLYWRIIGTQDKDGNGTNETLLIKKATATMCELKLYGIEGYNNGPEIMHKICKELYSSDEYGEARSITMEDMDNILEYTAKEGLYGIRTTENDVQIYEFEGKLKEMPIWNEILASEAYYTPDGANTIEELGEYQLNGHAYRIVEMNEEDITISSPAINAKEEKVIEPNIGEVIWTDQYGYGDNYLLATKGVIAEPTIVAFGLGSVSSNKYIRSFCDVYLSNGEGEMVFGRLCPVVELKGEIPEVISAPEEYKPENWYTLEI